MIGEMMFMRDSVREASAIEMMRDYSITLGDNHLM